MSSPMISLFYVKDVKGDHRLFSSEPVGLPVKKSKAKEAWELAKRKLMLLPQRTLRQEQALGRSLRMTEPTVRILHGAADTKHLNLKFKFFLNRQRGRRLAMLIGELILVPPSGLVAILPGPNVVFYALALLILTHWQSFRGVRHLLQKEIIYESSPELEAWEAAVEEKREADFPALLAAIETKYGLTGLRKVLWK
ncbi:MAG: hypothetical protein PHI34_07810 [Acidobacteriota bacterium]|nr:hypothetical protein [Acidobacteriota bacterium]